MRKLLAALVDHLRPRPPRAATARRTEAFDQAIPARDPEPAAAGPPVVDLSGSDTIDLPAFRPSDVPSVVHEFLDAACAAGLASVRIVHGRGIGVQRRIVRGILEQDPRVISFGDARDTSGWGATVARLRPPSPRPPGEETIPDAP